MSEAASFVSIFIMNILKNVAVSHFSAYFYYGHNVSLLG